MNEPQNRPLTPAEGEANRKNKDHIYDVRVLLTVFTGHLEKRAEEHDASKLRDPELPIFGEYTKKLADLTYGSGEYQACLKAMKPALDHHYAVNRHHPEHFENGVDGMSLVDLVEMFCDWQAATLRHKDGDLRKSIEINAGRFNLSPQLKSILLNTVGLLKTTNQKEKQP